MSCRWGTRSFLRSITSLAIGRQPKSDRTLRRSLAWLVTTACCVIVVASGSEARAHVDLDAPNGGEVLQVGSAFTIEWHVAIEHNTLDWDLWYSTTGSNGPWMPIAADLPAGDTTRGAPHSFEWTIPDTPSDEVRVRVRQDNSDTDYEDISDANLTIGAAPPGCMDNDEDGYGDPGNVACPNGPEEDCDDTEPAINPGAMEICDDILDNNCDTFADGDDPACSANIVVLQVGLTFEPADISASPGDTIEWRHSTGPHTVTSGSSCTHDGRFDLPLDMGNPIAFYTIPLGEPKGTIPYYCAPHCGQNMTGTITVTGPEPVPAVSEWGLLSMTLFVLICGTLVTRRQPSVR